MKIETEDYTTWIYETGVINDEPYKDYENTDGKKWRVYGTCNACGACEIGEEFHTNTRVHPETGERDTYTRYFTWVNKPGVPGACLEKDYEKRKDIPMTPDCINAIDECVLRGEWI
jgi:hypothetical protein